MEEGQDLLVGAEVVEGRPESVRDWVEGDGNRRKRPSQSRRRGQVSHPLSLGPKKGHKRRPVSTSDPTSCLRGPLPFLLFRLSSVPGILRDRRSPVEDCNRPRTSTPEIGRSTDHKQLLRLTRWTPRVGPVLTPDTFSCNLVTTHGVC